MLTPPMQLNPFDQNWSLLLAINHARYFANSSYPLKKLNNNTLVLILTTRIGKLKHPKFCNQLKYDKKSIFQSNI
jgi:hypothetical protein